MLNKNDIIISDIIKLEMKVETLEAKMELLEKLVLSMRCDISREHETIDDSHIRRMYEKLEVSIQC